MNNQTPNTISLVIPCYNEESSIPILIPKLLSTLNDLKKSFQVADFEVIVVDDGSTDSSYEKLGAFKQIKVVKNSGPRGYGSALKYGFLKTKYSWVCFMDMDNTYRPDDLKKFIEIKKENIDFIVGCRPFSSSGMPFTRALGNWIYRILAKFLFASNLKDVCSGYRFFKRDLIPEITSIPENGLNFSIFLSLWAISKDISVRQISIHYDSRQGLSKLSLFSDGISFLKVILLFKFRELYATKLS